MSLRLWTFWDVPFSGSLPGVVVGVIVAFVFLAPFVNRLRKSRGHREEYNSNMDALIGREVIVERAIPANGALGRVRIGR